MSLKIPVCRSSQKTHSPSLKELAELNVLQRVGTLLAGSFCVSVSLGTIAETLHGRSVCQEGGYDGKLAAGDFWPRISHLSNDTYRHVISGAKLLQRGHYLSEKDESSPS